MKNAILGTILGLLIALAIFWGCSGPSTGLPTVKMPIGSQTFTLEVAITFAEQRKGLMHREFMPADHGMIFSFAREETRSFWMENTNIPLDILYVDAKGKIVSIHAMKPLDKSSVVSDGPAQYAIELNQGSAAKAGVKAGDVLAIPREARLSDSK